MVVVSLNNIPEMVKAVEGNFSFKNMKEHDAWKVAMTIEPNLEDVVKDLQKLSVKLRKVFGEVEGNVTVGVLLGKGWFF